MTEESGVKLWGISNFEDWRSSFRKEIITNPGLRGIFTVIKGVMTKTSQGVFEKKGFIVISKLGEWFCKGQIVR
jgi:hypothetical protein